MSGLLQYLDADRINRTSVSLANPLPVTASAGSDAAPSVTRNAQGTPTQTTVAITSNVAINLLASGVAVVAPVRLLNYTTAVVYLQYGVGLTPAKGAPSDYIPAATGSGDTLQPGQWESLYIPTGGISGLGSASGNVAVQRAG